MMESWLRRQARIVPGRLALVGEGQRYTFAELADEAARRAAQLAQYGVPVTRRIGILAGNSIDTYLWLLAGQELGLELVLLNWRLSAQELERHHADAGQPLVLCDGEREVLAHALGADAATFAQLAEIYPLQPAPLVPGWDLERVCTILYTSGTSGAAKGVQLSFGNHWWSAMGSMLNLGLEPERDAWVCAVPLFHISGFAIMMRSLIYGIAVYLQPQFDPTAMNDLLLRGAATTTSVVPQMLQSLIDDLGDRRYPATVRAVLLGGGFAPETTLARCEDHDVPVVFSFGMTETASQCIALPSADRRRKRGSAGLPLAGVEIRIGAGLPAGEVGPIELRGPSITVGYLGAAGSGTTAVDEIGWFSTGDMGYLDDEGYLYVVARLSDLIISGGENIYPIEVERCLLEHPGVAQAAVVGRPSEQWGYVPVAYVVRHDPELDVDALREYLRARLAHYKVPAAIYWCEDLARTATGKVDRALLVNRAAVTSPS
ncbi:MAG: o-succinylbenzoate--CoA ligase [Propionibacteriaceae bacterium]